MVSDIANPIKFVVLPQRQTENDLQIVQLPHPSGIKTLFLLSDTELFQLQQFQNQYNSLAVDDFIVSDGSITSATPFDPIFILLPALEQARGYQTISDILYAYDSECPALHSIAKMNVDLSLICDIASNEDDPAAPYVKLSHEKLLRWLKAKVDYLASVVQQLQVFCDYKFPTEREKISVAIRLLSDNISEKLTEQLVKEYGLENLQGESVHYFEDQIKRTKKEEPKKEKVVKKAKKAGINATHAAGMKKMTDFFQKKPK